MLQILFSPFRLPSFSHHEKVFHAEGARRNDWGWGEVVVVAHVLRTIVIFNQFLIHVYTM